MQLSDQRISQVTQIFIVSRPVPEIRAHLDQWIRYQVGFIQLPARISLIYLVCTMVYPPSQASEAVAVLQIRFLRFIPRNGSEQHRITYPFRRLDFIYK